ncbi:signal peptide, CUB and EGF-like domain-containing protein 1 isoform X2 [Symsagittifera roscoffensis]|uniref:signal peptide, CUB and EGF-like domain-containing protein 1 isoform X2 n=1 Tax=Symsagittifera roscoffensis TaxID=84072 RepID=UPI00307B2303
MSCDRVAPTTPPPALLLLILFILLSTFFTPVSVAGSSHYGFKTATLPVRQTASVDLSHIRAASFYTSNTSIFSFDQSHLTPRGLLRMDLVNLHQIMSEIKSIEIQAELEISKDVPDLFSLHISTKSDSTGFGCKSQPCPLAELQIFNEQLSLHSNQFDHTYQSFRTTSEHYNDSISRQKIGSKKCFRIKIDDQGMVNALEYFISMNSDCFHVFTNRDSSISLLSRHFSRPLLNLKDETDLYIGLNRLVGSEKRSGTSLKRISMVVNAGFHQNELVILNSDWCRWIDEDQFYCSCQVGYIWNQNTHTCDDVDECSVMASVEVLSVLPTSCVHKCVNLQGSYDCDCHPGFKVDPQLFFNCIDIDECQESRNPCKIGRCVNTIGSYYCDCYGAEDSALYKSLTTSEYRSMCDGRTSHICRPMLGRLGGCQHYCHSTSRGTLCTCRPEYTSVGINQCRPTCYHGNFGCSQQCEMIDDMPTCTCYHGYEIDREHPNMCVDVNECEQRVNECTHGCVNTIGGYYCTCPDGLSWHVDQKTNTSYCADIDECRFLGRMLCDHLCVNTFGSYHCDCPSGGYELFGGKHCLDIDECTRLGDNGGCEHFCVNREGGFACECKQGYLLHANMFSCREISQCPQLTPSQHQTIKCKTVPNGDEECELTCDEHSAFFPFYGHPTSITLHCNVSQGGAFWYTRGGGDMLYSNQMGYMGAPDCHQPSRIFTKVEAHVALSGSFCTSTTEFINHNRNAFRKKVRSQLISAGLLDTCTKPFKCDVGNIYAQCVEKNSTHFGEDDKYFFIVPVKMYANLGPRERLVTSAHQIKSTVAFFIERHIVRVLTSGVLKSKRVRPLRKARVDERYFSVPTSLRMKQKECPSTNMFVDQSVTSCLRCPKVPTIATVSDSRGRSFCIDCGIGNEPNEDKTQCVKCSEPGFTLPGQKKCGGLCTPGHWGVYNAHETQSSCKKCRPGYFQPRHGRRECHKCTNGIVSPDRTECTNKVSCGQDYFSRNGSCEKCPDGMGTDDPGSSIARCKDRSCKHINLGSQSGAFSTPNWPYNYSIDSSCQMRIPDSVTRGTRSILIFISQIRIGANEELQGEIAIQGKKSGHTYFLYYKTSTYRPQVQFIRIDPELNDELVFEFKSSGGETDRGAVIFYFTIPDDSPFLNNPVLQDNFQQNILTRNIMKDVITNPIRVAQLVKIMQQVGDVCFKREPFTYGTRDLILPESVYNGFLMDFLVSPVIKVCMETQ